MTRFRLPCHHIHPLSRENRIFKEKYFVEKVINNSANGIIYKGFRKEDKIPVCVKQVPKSKVGTWSDISGRVVPNEFKMHIEAEKCEGVVQVLDWFERKSSFVCVMERPENSVDLFELSSRLGAFSEDPARIIFSQIVSTCSKLHQVGILHRDIKDENILVDVDTLETKLIDFGCATTFKEDEKLNEIAGTPEFFPPEVYTTGVYAPEASTVWSLGALLFVMLVGDLPFQTTEQITKREFRYPVRIEIE
ncbi:unnamed protein product [Oikopleura dioica]|uniref:Serine/threonine-protein kinase pim-1 n=1 Tax=Oikopleura dioica TaxID=34765 RepID=E4Y9U2_OIKDI|nr:unnamed protein product [Oikopleura dioica]